MKPQLTNVGKFTECVALMNLPVFSYIDSEDFAIVKLHEMVKTFPFYTPTMRPDFYNLTIVVDGIGVFNVGNDVFKLGPNHIVLTRPDAFHCSSWTEMDKAYNICFSKTFLSKYLPSGIDELQEEDKINGYSCCLTDEMMDDFEQVCLEMHDEAVYNSPYKYEILSNLILNLLLLIQQYQNKLKPPEIHNEKHISIVTTFRRNMEENITQVITGESSLILRAKEHASIQNLSETYLAKVVNNCTGKTINQWIDEKLMDEIKYMLKHTEKTMNEIATLFGFDLNYFYNYFKRHTQCAPGTFRKRFDASENHETLAVDKDNLIKAEI